MWHCSPLIPSPVTDFSSILSPNFYRANFEPLCSKVELKFMDCLEAYGLNKGSEKCADILYDLVECQTARFQKKRAQAIYQERMKKYRAGKLEKPFAEHPPLDAYMYI